MKFTRKVMRVVNRQATARRQLAAQLRAVKAVAERARRLGKLNI